MIAEACVDITDMSCVEECPVDCIYEGDRKLYIHPGECIDCGACEVVCPVEAISMKRALPDDQAHHAEDNERFFTQPLPGRGEPIGSPGGARKIGPIGVDTEMVHGLPARSADGVPR
ncbi:ferredoxin [Prauserella flavalba]|uniref:ferredoxin n=1 Tax=Prauserella flavalba TaxID=1477506 RepID=UPI00319E90C9